MKKFNLRNLSLIAILALMLSACGSNNQKSEKTDKEETKVEENVKDDSKKEASEKKDDKKTEGKIVIEDVLGRKVELDKPLDKVIIQGSGSGGPFMQMMYLDKDNFYKKIAAMDDGLRKNRNDLYQRLVKQIPELDKIKIVSNFTDNDFSVEELLSIDADGIIAPVSYKAQLDSIQDKLNLPVIYVDYHSQDLDKHLKSTEIISKATGLDKNFDKLYSFYKEKREHVANTLKEAKDKPNVFLECGQDGEVKFGNSYGNNTMWGKIVNDCGGHNLAGDALEAKQASPLSEEFVLSKDPDIIVITGSQWVDKPDAVRMGFDVNKKEVEEKIAKYNTRDGWSNLKAMKNKEFFVIGHNVARDMSDFYSYEALAKAFHPDLFKDIDPDKDMEEFYQNFMPIKYEGCWFAKYE
ncbi:ABC transporter substrate-binding protein [Anaerococcus tetradius]|uniref:ABC transporter substrate-binding protein n=1 Tax=Anaerococcus tetradius TaxID=33036 RepID=UPI0023F2AA04|nr:ABC transporter substrate-binding protein [Anaerococcus tetradius]